MKSTSVWLCDKQVSVYNTITLKLFQSVVSLLIFMDSVSRPELFYWKLCLVSEKTAVFTPNIVIRITITATTGVCTRVVHSACALTTARWCPAPVSHLGRITWHPPSISALSELHGVITLILDKLLAVWRDAGETSQLRYTRASVVNVTWVVPIGLISYHKCSVLTVVTVTPTLVLSVMLQYTENGSRAPLPSGSML